MGYSALPPVPAWTAVHPRIVAAGRYIHNPSHHPDWILEPQLIHRRVPGSDSLAKYAAAFFSMSRSIFTSASSFLVRAKSKGLLRLADISQFAGPLCLHPVP